MSCLCSNCHVVIFAETMEHDRDLEEEEMLGDIIANGRDEVASFLLDTVGSWKNGVKKRAMFMIGSAH